MNELETLIGRMLEGTLSNDERRDLEARLQREPAARRIYTEQCQWHAELALNTEVKPLLKAEELIAPAVGGNTAADPSGNAAMWRWIGVATAVGAVAGWAVLRYNPADLVAETEVSIVSLTPEAAYQEAEFSEHGSLSRPPTNFAVVTPTAGGYGGEISFNRDVRPILSENCYHCHGPDANTRKAELRLDIEANAFEPHGDYAAAIIRGDAENSPIFQRITSTKKSEIMPPADSHKTLTAAEKSIIHDWIIQGAEWESHWAFMKPEKAAPPPSNWGRGPIDAFIAAKQVALRLAPNRPADRATLARRLALDLTGLPPTPGQVADLVTDASPDAYERYVDALLATPAYGEHQARFWLDAARYADTHGLHLDNYREIWPYRDWVVQAFNRNQPFDEFTVEQIAGDLLPNPTEDQLLATGFSRCNPTTSEGGAIDDEYRAIYAKDRAETAATVYLGLTVGCAACHDHKFDPISQKDFYQFSAFFNNIDGPIMDTNRHDTRPNLVMPAAADEADWERLQVELKTANRELKRIEAEREDAFVDWLAAVSPDVIESTGLAGELWQLQLTPVAPDAAQIIAVAAPEETLAWTSRTAFTINLDHKLAQLAAGDETLIASQFDGDRGWRLYALSGDRDEPAAARLRFELIHSLAAGEMLAVTSQANRFASPPQLRASSLVVSYDGSGSAAGITMGHPRRVFIDSDLTIDALPPGEVGASELQLFASVERPEEADPSAGTTRIALYDRPHPLHVFDLLWKKGGLVKILAQVEESGETEMESKQLNQFRDFYFDLIDPTYREAKYEQAAIELAHNLIYERSTVSLIMKEREAAAIAHILYRGEYDQKGDEVAANVPEIMGGLPEEFPANRLGLARWLVADENPLTARVTVNRIWQNIFGIGLVATPEDFGIMGENPSHPELLDWLAVDFRESGWNVKAMIKQLVMTDTYRQNARIKADEYEVDPANRFLARGPRYRLDGEVIRDQALFVSGALHDQVGGPPVRPYQPTGIWNTVAYSGSNTRFYFEDEDDGLYRRSLYTFWKRTAPPPSMTIFDAPSRENCSVRRDRTNTPLQALTLMNDPQFVEAARRLAERALSPGGAIEQTPRGRIESMYRFAFGYEVPDAQEEVLHKSYLKFTEKFGEDPAGAVAFIQTGASAPMPVDDPVAFASLTMVASQIMNLDSFITKY